MPSTRRQIISSMNTGKRSTRSSVGFKTSNIKILHHTPKTKAVPSRTTPRKQKLRARPFFDDNAKAFATRASPRKQTLCTRKIDSLSEDIEEIIEIKTEEKELPNETISPKIDAKKIADVKSVSSKKKCVGANMKIKKSITVTKTEDNKHETLSTKSQGTKRSSEDTVDKPSKRSKIESEVNKTGHRRKIMPASENVLPRRSSRGIIPNRMFKDMDLNFSLPRKRRSKAEVTKEMEKTKEQNLINQPAGLGTLDVVTKGIPSSEKICLNKETPVDIISNSSSAGSTAEENDCSLDTESLEHSSASDIALGNDDSETADHKPVTDKREKNVETVVLTTEESENENIEETTTINSEKDAEGKMNMAPPSVDSPDARMASPSVDSQDARMASPSVDSPDVRIASPSVDSQVARMTSPLVDSRDARIASLSGDSMNASMASPLIENRDARIASPSGDSTDAIMATSSVDSTDDRMASPSGDSPDAIMATSSIDSTDDKMGSSSIDSTDSKNQARESNTGIDEVETKSLDRESQLVEKLSITELPEGTLNDTEMIPTTEVTISECGEVVYEDEGGLVTEVVSITTVEGEEADAIVGAVKQSGGLSLHQDEEKGNRLDSNKSAESEADQNVLELIEISGTIGTANSREGKDIKNVINSKTLPGSVVQKVSQTSSQIQVKIMNSGEVEESGKIITIDKPQRKSGTSNSSTQTPIMVSSRIADLPGRYKKSDTTPQIHTITVKVPPKPPNPEDAKEGENKEEDSKQKQEFVIVHLPEGTPIRRQQVREGRGDEAVPFYQEEDGTFVCGVCSYRTEKKANWYKHKKKHMFQKPHQCPKCNYKAATSSNLKRHLAIHEDIREYQCSVCMMTFRQKIHLVRHIKYRHEEKTVRCPLCDYVCANENPDLKIHIKRRHLTPEGEDGSVRAFCCDECGLMTVSKKDLKQHMKFHRRGPELKLYCEQCSFVTDCESRLRRHMFIHTNEKPFQCGLCEYRGSQKEHVLRHMKSQHNIVIQKKHRSAEDSSLDGSTDDNTPDKKGEKLDYSSQEKIFACNHCSMKFAKLLNLYKHLHAQHKSILPAQRDDEFLCVVCDFRTCSKKNLLVHMRKHNIIDQGPPSHVYSCVLCRYLNPKRRNLFQHMKKKHNIEIVMKDDGSTSCFVADNATSVSGRDESVQNILTVGDIVTTSTEDSQLQIVTEDGGKDAVQVQNVISIEDLAYAVSHPQPNNQSNMVILEQALSGLAQSSSQSNAVVQPEAAEAIEGLQALAEQPGILECQEIITDHDQTDHQTLTIDEMTISRPENIMETEVVTMGTDIVPPVEPEIEKEDEAETEGQSNIQLSAEQLMNLSTGDFVEINGEMYKVEISSEENTNETELDGQDGNVAEGSAGENTVFLQKVSGAEITTDSTEVVEEFEQLVQNQEEQSSEILKVHPENVFTIEDSAIMGGEILEGIKSDSVGLVEQAEENLLTSSGPSNVMTVVGQVTSINDNNL